MRCNTVVDLCPPRQPFRGCLWGVRSGQSRSGKPFLPSPCFDPVMIARLGNSLPFMFFSKNLVAQASRLRRMRLRCLPQDGPVNISDNKRLAAHRGTQTQGMMLMAGPALQISFWEAPCCKEIAKPMIFAHSWHRPTFVGVLCRPIWPN